MIEALGADIGTFTYDGDTPQDARKAIRARAHVVVTNPDMLHKGILPHHTKWVKLFENLRYVVIDELHSLPRRLRLARGQRLPAAAAALPLLRLATRSSSARSATIGNPKELAEALTEREMTLVDESGAPRGEQLLRDLQPAGREPPARHPQVGARLGARRRALVPGQGAADDRVRARRASRPRCS